MMAGVLTCISITQRLFQLSLFSLQHQCLNSEPANTWACLCLRRGMWASGNANDNLKAFPCFSLQTFECALQQHATVTSKESSAFNAGREKKFLLKKKKVSPSAIRSLLQSQSFFILNLHGQKQITLDTKNHLNCKILQLLQGKNENGYRMNFILKNPKNFVSREMRVWESVSMNATSSMNISYGSDS